MTEPLNLQRELADHNLEPFPLVEGAYKDQDQTPAHSFSTIITPVSGEPFFLALTARDFFDDMFAANILEFVRNRWRSVLPNRPVSIIEGFQYAGYDFDSIAVLSPHCGNIFEHENDKLNSRTLVVFPMFRCEFSGEETTELVDIIRHDFVCTVDWKRQVSPQVYLRFRNTKTGVRSTGNTLGLTSANVLFDQLHELAADNGSFIEVKNYKGELCHISREDDNYTISLVHSQDCFKVTADQIDGWITSYLTKGLPSVGRERVV